MGTWIYDIEVLNVRYAILAVIAVDVVFGLACFKMGSVQSRLEEKTWRK